MDKKGVLGLETAKAFLVLLMIVAIIVVAGIILMSELSTNSLADVQQATVHITNASTESTAVCGNTTACYVDGTRALDNCVLTVTQIHNATTTADFPASTANYSVSGCQLTGTPASTEWLEGVWRVTGYYDHTSDEGIENTMQNVSGGFRDFFDNASAWFSLLAIVVIIMIIAIVIITVNRFGSGESGLREAGGATGQL